MEESTKIPGKKKDFQRKTNGIGKLHMRGRFGE